VHGSPLTPVTTFATRFEPRPLTAEGPRTSKLIPVWPVLGAIVGLEIVPEVAPARVDSASELWEVELIIVIPLGAVSGVVVVAPVAVPNANRYELPSVRVSEHVG
jgi:hypothetical protein